MFRSWAQADLSSQLGLARLDSGPDTAVVAIGHAGSSIVR